MQLDYHLLYIPYKASIKRQIPAANQHFFLGIATLFYWFYCCRVKAPEKNINIFGLKSPYHRITNRNKLILPLEKYLKTLKNMIIGTVGTLIYNFWQWMKRWCQNIGIRCYQVHLQIKLQLILILQNSSSVVQCDVTIVKILLLVVYKWFQINFDVNTYVLFPDLVLCLVLFS